MLSKLRRPSHATVVAYLALFVAVGGTAYAAATITGDDVVNNSLTGADIKGHAATISEPEQDGSLTTYDVKDATLRASDLANDSVGSAELINDSVTRSDIAASSIGSAKVIDDSLTGADIDESTLSLSGAYGYVYNLTPQTVAVEADVLFDSNGALSGIVHAAGSSQITFADAGTYKVTFAVTAVEPNQMALFVNGLAVPGTVYGSGAGTQQNNGQVIASVTAGDVLTLRNHSSAAAVGLPSLAGGTQANVNASILIEQLA